MKYEMIFGDASLFDGAENCDEYLVAVQHSVGQKTKVSFYPSLVEAFNYVTDFPPRGVVFHRAAMRRIIKEPKRWTWEDKKAGRLPEVGCDMQYIDSQKRVSVIAINSNEVVLLAKSNGSKFFVLDPDSLLQYYNPIETPAEKAQREEDEFFFALKDEWQNQKSPPISSASFEAGIRAAYRKLKGGE